MRFAQTSWRVCPDELHKLSRIAVIQLSIDDFMHCRASSDAFLFNMYIYLAFLTMIYDEKYDFEIFGIFLNIELAHYLGRKYITTAYGLLLI